MARKVALGFRGDVGDCGAGSEKMRDPADGREIQGAVYPMTLGIMGAAQVLAQSTCCNSEFAIWPSCKQQVV